ncbi:MAG: sensor histidine kinase, partial [Spirochaetaceae bacterium]
RCGDYLRCRHCLEHQEGCGDTPLCCDCELDAAIRHVLNGGSGVPEQDKEIERFEDGAIWIRFAVVPLTLDGGRCALLVAQDISARKRAESDMARQLVEKESLLKEIHHRVKNNIGAIASLLSLQADSAVGTETRGALEDAASRVRSMSALYERLLLGEEYQDVSMRDYAEGVITSIARVYPHNGSITVETRIADFAIDARRAVSVGIILNELVTNAFKYAFVDRDAGSLSVAIEESGSGVTVTVHDDGIGSGTGVDNDAPTGFGLALVRMLAEQLDGSFAMENHQGTTSVVKFKL